MLDDLDDGARIGVWTVLGVVAFLLFGLLGGLALKTVHAKAKPAADRQGTGRGRRPRLRHRQAGRRPAGRRRGRHAVLRLGAAALPDDAPAAVAAIKTAADAAPGRSSCCRASTTPRATRRRMPNWPRSAPRPCGPRCRPPAWTPPAWRCASPNRPPARRRQAGAARRGAAPAVGQGRQRGRAAGAGRVRAFPRRDPGPCGDNAGEGPNLPAPLLYLPLLPDIGGDAPGRRALAAAAVA
jgi:hypothetical protein